MLEGEKTTQISRYWTGHCYRPLSLSWFSGEHLLVIAGLLRGRYPNGGFPESTYVGSSDSPIPPLLNSSLPLQFLFPKVLPTDFSDSYFSVLELWKLISFLCQMVEDNQQTSQFWIPQNFPITQLWNGVRICCVPLKDVSWLFDTLPSFSSCLLIWTWVWWDENIDYIRVSSALD